MNHATAAPRLDVLLSRVDAWADQGAVRAVLVKVGVAVIGPLVVLTGLAMLVLPGPGLLVIFAGLALLALEYAWARRALVILASGASSLRQATFSKEASPRRRALGVLLTVGIVAGGFAATAVCTAFLGAHTVL